MKDFIKELYSERLEEREDFLKTIIDDYKRTGQDIFKDLHLKEDTFFKQYREGKLPLNTIKKASDLLNIEATERKFIFFGEFENQKEIDGILKGIKQTLETIPDDKKEDFIDNLTIGIRILEECL